MTFVCVPIVVEGAERALAEAALAAEHGADLVELRIDGFFDGSDERAADVARLVEQSPLPTIVTCRHESEGGESDLDASVVADLYEHLAGQTRPPRYVDIECARCGPVADQLAAIGGGETGVIVSMHDFEGRPADLTRRLSAAYAADYASVVKVAYRARSLRDNLELFDLLVEAPKPTIALGMGEFGLMSRVLAPKFGGLLTFAALRDSAATAPGQPTLDELFNLYRFRKIGRETKVYGVIGWPVTHSMSPLVHNAGFEAIGWDGVYLPLPVAADEKDAEASYASFKATVLDFTESETLPFHGASITLPYKEAAYQLGEEQKDAWQSDEFVLEVSASNTLVRHGVVVLENTDADALVEIVRSTLSEHGLVSVIGAGGVAHAAAFAALRANKSLAVFARKKRRARKLLDEIEAKFQTRNIRTINFMAHDIKALPEVFAAMYINCTPVGMKDGPDPEGMSIPVDELAGKLPPETVFFDTVYNPIETPMLKAAKAHGFRTIDGVQMFVAQAEAQFELWTGQKPPEGLFDRLVRDRLSAE